MKLKRGFHRRTEPAHGHPASALIPPSEELQPGCQLLWVPIQRDAELLVQPQQTGAARASNWFAVTELNLI